MFKRTSRGFPPRQFLIILAERGLSWRCLQLVIYFINRFLIDQKFNRVGDQFAERMSPCLQCMNPCIDDQVTTQIADCMACLLHLVVPMLVTTVFRQTRR